MTVTQDLSFVSLITNASVLVQLVMALLLVVSLMSWTYIFSKLFAIRSARVQTDEFEHAFWSGGNLQSLYQRGSQRAGALERIFQAGMSEYITPTASYANLRSSIPGHCLTARAAQCGQATSAKWMVSNRI